MMDAEAKRRIAMVRLRALKALAEEQAKNRAPDEMVTLNLDDDTSQIQSVEELSEELASLPEDRGALFLCMNKSSMEEPAVGDSLTKRCDGCGEEVWMSPATSGVYEATERKTILCNVCVDAAAAATSRLN